MNQQLLRQVEPALLIRGMYPLSSLLDGRGHVRCPWVQENDESQKPKYFFYKGNSVVENGDILLSSLFLVLSMFSSRLFSNSDSTRTSCSVSHLLLSFVSILDEGEDWGGFVCVWGGSVSVVWVTWMYSTWSMRFLGLWCGTQS